MDSQISVEKSGFQKKPKQQGKDWPGIQHMKWLNNLGQCCHALLK